MQTTLILAGVAFIGAAIVGGGLIAFQIEIPLVDSLPRQLMLAAFGVVLMSIGILSEGDREDGDDRAESAGAIATDRVDDTSPTTSTAVTMTSAESVAGDTVVESTSEVEEVVGGSSDDPVDFVEAFDGSLDASWEWFLENPDDWTLTAEPGWLQLVAGAAEQNLLLRDAPNNAYEVSTVVRFAPTSNFQFAGLVLGPASDATTLVQFGRSYCDPELPGCVGDGVYFDDVVAGELVGNASAELPPGIDILHLRVVFDGATYLASFSIDGDAWQFVGQHTGAYGEDRVGVIAHQGFEEPAIAQFDSVAVMSPPGPSTQPSFEEIAATYPDGIVCDTNVDLLGANPDGSVKIRFPPNTPLFDDRIEFPCWGMRLTVLTDLDILGVPAVAGSTLAVGPGTNPAVLVDETGDSGSETVGTFVDNWFPPAGLSLVAITP